MSSRNEGANNETRELDSSDEEAPINPEVRILSRIFGVHRASVASMPGTSGSSHHSTASQPTPRRTPRERNRVFWTLLGNSSRNTNTRCRSGGAPPRGPRPAAYADLLEPDRRARGWLLHNAAPSGSEPPPHTRASLANLHCSLRNMLSKRSYPANPTGNVTGPSSRPVLVLRAASGHSRGGDDADGRDRGERTDHDRDRSDRDRTDLDRSDLDRSDRDRSDLDRSDRDRSDLDRSDRDRSDRDRSDRDRSDLDRSDRDRSDRDRSDLDRSDRDRSDRDRGGSRDLEDRHRSAVPIDSIDIDALDDIPEPPGPPPAFSPSADADAEYFADERLQAEEPLNMSAGALLEEEIIEVEPQTEPAQRANADDEAETADTSTKSSQQRGTKRKREVTGETQDSALALNKSILRLLECPVCMEWMEPPIAQCRRGHLVCGTCRKRLDSCPVCRTPFSSVRNRAMEDVAGVLRYPCRHSCGRWLRAPRRHKHEASCAARRHACPYTVCRPVPPMSRSKLAAHCQSKHPEYFKTGPVQLVPLGVRTEQHIQWVVVALGALFHLRVDMAVHTWGVCALVQHLGPQNEARKYTYEVTVNGRHSARRLVYRRATHSDLQNPALDTGRQDCFHLTLDQALNYLRYKNEHTETERTLDLTITLAKAEADEAAAEDS